jgi:simple sugar transport system permease protein
VARAGSAAIAIVGAFGLAIAILVLIDAPPWETVRLLFEGSVGTKGKLAATLMAWVPLVLASAGLIITFGAGLWNIGIEGQITMGAIAAAWAARVIPGGPWIVIPAAFLAGVIGGILWALFAGVLKTRGKVNEIFGGLGLDFVASGLAIYLVVGPWARAGIASTSGTDLFRPEVWLPTLGPTLAPSAVVIAIAGVILVYVLMRGTLFGLRLKAVGKNARSATILGIPTERYVLGAFALCGALAGIAGAIQAIGVHHKLVPSISGGYGFLGILVVLLAGFRAALIAPIAFFFVMLAVGSTALELRLGLDSALGGVLTGVLVLFVVLAGGWQLRRAGRSGERAATTEES